MVAKLHTPGIRLHLNIRMHADLCVRWHRGQMYVKLRADSCPPLALFLQTESGETPNDWSRRVKAVDDQGYYIEIKKKGSRPRRRDRVVPQEYNDTAVGYGSRRCGR